VIEIELVCSCMRTPIGDQFRYILEFYVWRCRLSTLEQNRFCSFTITTIDVMYLSVTVGKLTKVGGPANE
jgi:hypothetical protein